MGQYTHHVFVCTTGGNPVDDYRYLAPPGDNKIVEGDPAP